MPARDKKTIHLLVDNEFGVLTRVTAMVRREGWNIDSLAVTMTENPDLSQMLITVECIVSTLPRVLGRLNKLSSVKKATVVEGDFNLTEELSTLFLKNHLVWEEGTQHESIE